MKGFIVQHKGYSAFARFYPEDGIFHGSLEGYNVCATFGGETEEEAIADFCEMIDECIDDDILTKKDRDDTERS